VTHRQIRSTKATFQALSTAGLKGTEKCVRQGQKSGKMSNFRTFHHVGPLLLDFLLKRDLSQLETCAELVIVLALCDNAIKTNKNMLIRF
jgi:hypothetical protein